MEPRTWCSLRARSAWAAVSKPAILLVVLLPALLPAQERWTIQYFYDKPDSSLDIVDLKCPSPQHCVAAGVILEKSGREKGAIVLTRDGGAHWTLMDIRETPLSLFFLDDSQGWLTTSHGIWSTDEGGSSWTKIETLKGLTRVYFLDPSHGYAIGFPKIVYETRDGGKKWTKLAAASLPAPDPKHTVYACISFHDQHGVIIGVFERDDPEQFSPSRLNASATEAEANSVIAVLETFDGGQTWKAKTDAILGEVTTVSVSNESILLLLRYFHAYSLPSSLVRWANGSSKLEVIFAERKRAVTDFALLPNGGAILAAIEPPGTSNQIPVPGKLKILESADLKKWRDMEVDYRAVAQRAVVAAPDTQHQWVATDTGMILALRHGESPTRK